MTKRFFDAKTIESTGAFLQGELERLDQKIYEPIAEFTYGRDIDLRQDVTIADETSSFMLSNYAGGVSGTGHGTKAWASQKDGTIPRVDIQMSKTLHPLTPWAMEVGFDVFELAKAQQVGRPIDSQKHDAMRMRHHRDIDEQVYIGDAETGATGLLNDASVAKSNVGAFNPATASADDFLELINTVLEASYKNTQFIMVPDRILLPPEFMAFMSKPMVIGSTPLSITVAEYVRQKSLTYTISGKELQMYPCRWLSKTMQGASFASGRIVAYTKRKDLVRFPLVELQSTPVQYDGLRQNTIYYGALGQVEVVRPETMFYGDCVAA
ncbi:MAG TPA: DUF2184 domain-containing protein [Candidatus Aphodousia gallistercoris]|nr:DUF2184 domain-containing protein [Candidatus Aphodousia gallistercoris]